MSTDGQDFNATVNHSISISMHSYGMFVIFIVLILGQTCRWIFYQEVFSIDTFYCALGTRTTCQRLAYQERKGQEQKGKSEHFYASTIIALVVLE